MTGRASRLPVFANQIEWNPVMVKVRAVGIQPIVTGCAICPEGDEVLGGKGLIDAEMAVAANRLIHRSGVSLGVAILTGKGCAVGFGLMGV